MRTVCLSDVADINPRLPKQLATSSDTPVAFLPMAAVSEDGYIAESDERIMKDVMKGYRYFERGDVLIAKITPCMENGKAAVVDDIPHQIGFGSTEFHVLRPSKELDPHYLFYMIWNPQFRFIAARNMTGTAGQRRVPTDFLRRFQIPLPPLPEQKRIAAILDKADAVRRKRQEAIRLTEAFLRSVFLDMFGDPVTNPKGWRMVNVGDITTDVRDGPHVSPKYSDSGIPILSTRNIRPGQLLMNEVKYVTEETYSYLTRKFRPQKHDVLLTKGGTTGYAKAVDWNWPFAIWVHLAALRPKRNVRPLYLESALNTPNCYQQSQRYTHGITNQDLGLTRMRKIILALPPIDLQDQYCRSHERIMCTIEHANETASVHDNLFNSLVQRAFRGEL